MPVLLKMPVFVGIIIIVIIVLLILGVVIKLTAKKPE
jgi:hypothetical protein